jgi:small-conductance mechanosensitive channel
MIDDSTTSPNATMSTTPSAVAESTPFDFQQALVSVETWINQNVFSADIYIQLAVAIVIIMVARATSRKPIRFIEGYLARKWDADTLDHYNEEALIELLFPITSLLLILFAIAIASTESTMPMALIIIAKLLTAWIIIRTFTSLVRIKSLSRTIASIAWAIAALSIIDKLAPAVEFLDGCHNSCAVMLGDSRITPLTLIKGIITFTILLWLVGIVSRITDRKINTMHNITPSARVLLTKTIKISLIALAIFIGIDSIGIDLTALAVFGGAIGLGLGFGLQKVVSNLVCGVILLLDRSVKPGDVIEVDNSYGEVNALGARCVSVITRDGFEHLIPNENLITEKVVNWSYSTPNVRLKIPVSIDYNSDLRGALELIEASANSCKRVLKTPAPACRVLAFADSGIDIELRVWINSPSEGIVNVRSEILLAIWDIFEEHKINIPFPQSEVTLKPSEEMQKMMETVIRKLNAEQKTEIR